MHLGHVQHDYLCEAFNACEEYLQPGKHRKHAKHIKHVKHVKDDYHVMYAKVMKKDYHVKHVYQGIRLALHVMHDFSMRSMNVATKDS